MIDGAEFLSAHVFKLLQLLVYESEVLLLLPFQLVNPLQNLFALFLNYLVDYLKGYLLDYALGFLKDQFSAPSTDTILYKATFYLSGCQAVCTNLRFSCPQGYQG